MKLTNFVTEQIIGDKLRHNELKYMTESALRAQKKHKNQKDQRAEEREEKERQKKKRDREREREENGKREKERRRKDKDRDRSGADQESTEDSRTLTDEELEQSKKIYEKSHLKSAWIHGIHF